MTLKEVQETLKAVEEELAAAKITIMALVPERDRLRRLEETLLLELYPADKVTKCHEAGEKAVKQKQKSKVEQLRDLIANMSEEELRTLKENK